MWLLSTDRAELHYFISPEAVPGGYAILSHVWTNDETQFHDLRAVQTRCKETGENPRDLVSSKIRQFCILSAKHGYTYAWADTCCIDKSSSAELSETINSMFHYYSLAGVCYAYLSDVAAKDGKLDHDAFDKSRWHTRGWTLQELLAPRLLLFLSRDWETLGTKAELAEALEGATKIPVSILQFEEEIRDVSIAQRMSWASRRETTRIEDEAYCLMGIFDINMPMLYGEGRKAFQRLQEEIMRTSTDTSLFAWGLYGSASRDEEHHHFEPSSYLLAPSPGSFVDSHSVNFEPHADFPVVSDHSTAFRARSDIGFRRNVPSHSPLLPLACSPTYPSWCSAPAPSSSSPVLTPSQSLSASSSHPAHSPQIAPARSSTPPCVGSSCSPQRTFAPSGHDWASPRRPRDGSGQTYSSHTPSGPTPKPPAALSRS
ncbi:heterokaryon incompatibility protein-domain-containing protein [Epithele typhae]|uniref:heterokaryon incompatibility protein-domain-containing protein n=1 Tax=Epithele typhae TaxID=378194 RepID=UPI0020083C4F|nr:heterokaryon incompatibility protein-domain-containing protein [Epithele typhae]KAH9910402.1 heterokaryon incompatibility protein-domain-containing protein [Epithele typhae]